jgi:hypothetical protein
MFGSHRSLIGTIMIIGRRMDIHFKALGRNLWRIVMEGYVILDPKNKTEDDDKNEKTQ